MWGNNGVEASSVTMEVTHIGAGREPRPAGGGVGNRAYQQVRGTGQQADWGEGGDCQQAEGSSQQARGVIFAGMGFKPASRGRVSRQQGVTGSGSALGKGGS